MGFPGKSCNLPGNLGYLLLVIRFVGTVAAAPDPSKISVEND